jgi:hypothetical protein
VSEDFKFQISVKFGEGMVNVRAKDAQEFADALAFAHKNAPQLLAFCEEFKPHKIPSFGGGSATSAPPEPAAAPFSNPPGAHVTKVTGIEEKSGISEKTGKPWTKWNVSFSDGRKAGTFDQLLVSVARKIFSEGSGCVAVCSQNGKYWNLDRIDRAAA